MTNLESPRNVIIGSYYWVPCVHTAFDWTRKMGWIPVIGPPHIDPEINPTLGQHLHHDARFLSDRQINSMFGPGCRDVQVVRKLLTFVVLNPTEVQLKLRKCWRQMPDFPWKNAQPRWLPALSRLYEHCRIDPANPICPHRRLPLVGVPNAEGVVVCSGHGLRWNLITGAPAWDC